MGGINTLESKKVDEKRDRLNALSEIELKVLIESQRKTIEEVARDFRLEQEAVVEILDSANRKISKDDVRSLPSEEGEPTKAFLPRPTAFRLEKNLGKPQVGTMKVGSQIVELLSKGIYSAPWNSLKELISNSFDADAKKVEIKYFPKESKLVISDDGSGMDYLDFDEHFAFIVRSLKRESGLLTPIFNRPIIGKIGIGFLAISELCDAITITSAKRGSDTYFVAEINFESMRSKEAKKKEFYEVSKYILTNYEKEDVKEHYTKIELRKLKEAFIDVLENRSLESSFVPVKSIKSLKQIIETAGAKGVRDVKADFGPYWEFLVNLALVIPVAYPDEGPFPFLEEAVELNIDPDEYDKKMRQYLQETIRIVDDLKVKLKKYNFKVYFNSMELKKPIFLPNEEWLKEGEYGNKIGLFPINEEIEVKDPATEGVAKISFKGYIYYQKSRIVPKQLRGLIVRIKNVAVGGPSLDFWEHPFSGDDIYFPQTLGELYFETGLEDAMNIDRSTFKTSYYEYDATAKILHSYLRNKVFSTAKNMWKRRRKQKAQSRDEAIAEARENVVEKTLGTKYQFNKTRKFTDETVKIDKDKKSVTLNVLSDQFQGFKKQDRLLLEDVALALSIATNETQDVKKVGDIFWKVLKEITEYRRS
jgi:hypothetical protein